MPDEVINMLTGVTTEELSLVRRGANNKRIALTKDHQMTIAQLLKSVLATEAEGEKELVAKLKKSGANDDAVEIAVANFRMQSGFKDKLSKEQFSEIVKAAGFAKAGHDDEDEEDEKTDHKAEDEEEDPKKPGFLMNGKKMEKSHMTSEMKKAFDEQSATIAKLEKSAKESYDKVVKLEKAAELKGHIAKCEKEFPHVPGMTVEAMGEKLQKAFEVSDDFGKQQEKEWATVSAALKNSTLLKTQGHINSDDGSSAMGRVNKIAKELRSSDSSLTKEQAVAKALDENPELYNEYLSDNPAQC